MKSSHYIFSLIVHGTHVVSSPANNPCSKDPLCKAVSKAVNSGIVVVVAAGNSGPIKKESKRKLLDSCIDMKESKESQGVGMINLEKLFKDAPSGEKEKGELNQDISQFFNSPILETFLALLFVILLLENN